jgi:ABC-2 type transport system ATP-binding protein
VAFRTASPLDVQEFRGLASVQGAEVDEDGVVLKTNQISQTVIELVRLLEAKNNELIDLRILRPSLEDVFIELTGKRLRD